MKTFRLKYRVYYNVANQPNCSSSSSFPCWTDITSVSRYVALTATSLLSTYVDSFTELFSESLYIKCSFTSFCLKEPELSDCNSAVSITAIIKTFSHRCVMIWYYNSSYLYLWTKIIVKKKLPYKDESVIFLFSLHGGLLWK